MPLRRAVVYLLLLAGSTVLQPPAATQSLQVVANTNSEAERRLLEMLNQSRIQQGLAPLRMDQRLTAAAREHSRVMADRGQLSHQLPGEANLSRRLRDSQVAFISAGENIDMGNGWQQAHSAFMASPPHRANILDDDYENVGIGVVERHGTYWITEDFARPIR
ncbi:MAG TPA: CAP domain-containing protein [Terriglobales bacterium]|nr:CAP domain-containing protein [Terriglobales bacterium]